jgi:hypothetical protein
LVARRKRPEGWHNWVVLKHDEWIVEAESKEEAVELLVKDGAVKADCTFLVHEVSIVGVTVMGHPLQELEGPPR